VKVQTQSTVNKWWLLTSIGSAARAETVLDHW
jgi:hypothetical protein